MSNKITLSETFWLERKIRRFHAENIQINGTENMIQLLNPKTISAPNGTYSHGVLVTEASKFLVISGQVAIKSDGTVPDSLIEQCEVVWGNILAILEESDMSIKNLIKINSYLTSPEQIKNFVEIRAKYLQGHCPASTLVVVSALADPRFLIEIEGYASLGI